MVTLEAPDITIAGEELQKLGVCSKRPALSREGVFIMPHPAVTQSGIFILPHLL
jgi:hypothetical protein